jgi:D-alanyl-D-alanine carboxypeptidase
MQTGWLEQEDGQYFLGDNGALSTGWVEMEDGRRYFDDDGRMQVGWLETEEGKYFLADTGLMQTGWSDTDEGSKFFNHQGLLQENWVQTEAGRQYLTDDGKYLIGWLETEDGRYYFNKDGVMQTGWVTDVKGRYYLYEDGTFATGFVEVGGVKRYFTPNGEYVILCNRWNPIPDDYEMNLVKIGNFKLDASCYDAMLEMMDAAKADGITIKLNSTYRSKATQQAMWESRRIKYMGQGMTLKEADEYIGRSVAVPGTSEHQTGLAADINGPQKVYDWLAENSWKYGFILRYPDEKIDITGIIFEPWHFRYVGKELAKDIFDSGLCMEEYFAELEKKEA